MAKEFCWVTYYAKRTKRRNQIDTELERIRRKAKRLMDERLALDREGYGNGRDANHSAGA